MAQGQAPGQGQERDLPKVGHPKVDAEVTKAFLEEVAQHGKFANPGDEIKRLTEREGLAKALVDDYLTRHKMLSPEGIPKDAKAHELQKELTHYAFSGMNGNFDALKELSDPTKQATAKEFGTLMGEYGITVWTGQNMKDASGKTYNVVGLVPNQEHGLELRHYTNPSKDVTLASTNHMGDEVLYSSSSSQIASVKQQIVHSLRSVKDID